VTNKNGKKLLKALKKRSERKNASSKLLTRRTKKQRKAMRIKVLVPL
jgi:hypothetical protein